MTCEKEGGFLDLFLMIKNGRVEWKTYTKTPPLYLSKFSCHDPTVFKGIPKGVGYRLRITNSMKETFKENVELYSRSMAISGYDYQMVKKEMMKFEHVDPIELVKKTGNKTKSNRFKPGCRAFYVSSYDPRLPHPRKLISRNYEILANSEKAKSLFPRENLVAGSKRLPNLGEILNPTIQSSKPDSPTPGQDDNNHPARRGAIGRTPDDDQGPELPTRGQESCRQPITRQNRDVLPSRKRRKGIVQLEDGMHQQENQDVSEQGGGVAPQFATTEQPTCLHNTSQGPEQEPEPPANGQDVVVLPDNIQRNGSFHCELYKNTRRCDFCSHMVKTRSILAATSKDDMQLQEKMFTSKLLKK